MNTFLCYRFRKCDIQGAPDGILKGKKVAIKDNVCVAGVPMMNGSHILDGYTPDTDAAVVTRILDAGTCRPSMHRVFEHKEALT